jgi:hypothetical protein
MSSKKRKEKVDIFIECPHCKGTVNIKWINCSIFRHGTFKHNNRQIPSHESKEKCDKYVEDDAIYGCGKPFKLIQKKNEEEKIEYDAIICDYI